MGADEGWILYPAQSRPSRLKPDEVSLTKTNLVIAEQLFERFEALSVVLEFRAEPRAIRIRPAEKNEVGYKVSYRSISSRSFYTHFDIKERGRYKAVCRNGAIFIDLQPST